MASAGAGRPRLSSPRVLEDAAQELFLEQGYAHTSIDDIATRAGVSRNTFFNYFPTKSDLLWAEFDARVGALAEELDAQPRTLAGIDAVRNAVLAVAGRFGVDSVPWAVTHAELMGTGSEFATSGLSRFAGLAAVIQRFLTDRGGPDVDPSSVRAVTWALLGSVAAAGAEWIAAGVGREPLESYVVRAISSGR